MDDSRRESVRSSTSLDRMGDGSRSPGGLATAVMAGGKRPATTGRHALALVEALCMCPLQAHCHLGLGTMDAKTDPPEEAHAEPTTAIHLYRAMDIAFELTQAEAALVYIGG
jgi:hypothetical protein